MRPIQKMGLNPDGVHRFLFMKSRGGDLYVNRAMAALEYGTDVERFTDCLSDLLEDGRVAARRVLPNVRLEYYQVTEPENYDQHHPRFGQTGRPAWRFSPTRELTEDEMSDAIDLYEQMLDDFLDAEDAEDEIDELEEG